MDESFEQIDAEIEAAETLEEPADAEDLDGEAESAVLSAEARESEDTIFRGAGLPGLAGGDPLTTEQEKQSRPQSVFARIYENEQLVSGTTRWSIGSSRRACSSCAEELPEKVPFYTALCQSENRDGVNKEASAVFERRDFCVNCFEGDQRPLSFAHWRAVLPAPPEAPQKIVNLASLRVYFDQLGEMLAMSEVTEDAMNDGAGTEESALGKVALSDRQQSEVIRLRYLVGLFLVRKRALRWQGLDGAELVLDCKSTELVYRLAVPEQDAELDRAAEAFETLFS